MTAMKLWRALLITALSGSLCAAGVVDSGPAGATVNWGNGDVFVGVDNGTYHVFDNNGNLKDSIADGIGGITTGCAFNPAETKLYTTNWTHDKVEVYDTASHVLIQTINTTGGLNESVVFTSAGDFYVSHPLGGGIDHYAADGTLLGTLATGVRTDWMDLAADQKTMFFSDEGGTIHRWDVVNNVRLPDFATVPTGSAYALRLLPPGDGGGLLVAAGSAVLRLNSSGGVAQTYTDPARPGTLFFSLALDTDGTSFWVGAPGTDSIYRLNIATGAIELGPVNTQGTTADGADGICLKGEPTAATSAALSVTKTGSPNPVTVGGVLTYTVTVSNAGPASATDATMTDPLPAGVTFLSATASQGSCGQAAGTVTCQLGTIPSGGSATIAIQVSPTGKGSLTNTARAAADQPNPNPAAAVATTADRALSVNGSAFGEQVRSLLVNSGPLPTVSLSSPGTRSDSLASISLAGLLSADNLVVNTQVGNDATVASSADITDADLVAGTVTATGIHSACTANPTAATGTTTIAKLVVGGQTLLNISPAPNTGINIAGIGTLLLNEQTSTPAGGIVVNALHLHLLLGTDIVLAQSTCLVDP
jgi:uncharacterized repeat protein (TIGR01451 family)